VTGACLDAHGHGFVGTSDAGTAAGETRTSRRLLKGTRGDTMSRRLPRRNAVQLLFPGGHKSARGALNAARRRTGFDTGGGRDRSARDGTRPETGGLCDSCGLGSRLADPARRLLPANAIFFRECLTPCGKKSRGGHPRLTHGRPDGLELPADAADRRQGPEADREVVRAGRARPIGGRLSPGAETCRQDVASLASV
jgi:hypothetical protein